MKDQTTVETSVLAKLFDSVMSGLDILLSLRDDHSDPNVQSPPATHTSVLHLSSQLFGIPVPTMIKEFCVLLGRDLGLDTSPSTDDGPQTTRKARKRRFSEVAADITVECPSPKRRRIAKVTIRPTQREMPTAVPLRRKLLAYRTLKQVKETRIPCCHAQCWRDWNYTCSARRR